MFKIVIFCNLLPYTWHVIFRCFSQFTEYSILLLDLFFILLLQLPKYIEFIGKFSRNSPWLFGLYLAHTFLSAFWRHIWNLSLSTYFEQLVNSVNMYFSLKYNELCKCTHCFDDNLCANGILLVAKTRKKQNTDVSKEPTPWC